MKLLPHQIKVLEETEDFHNVAYYLDMGLGKTFIGAEKAIQLRKNILLVCQKSKIKDWIEHFETYYSEHPYLIEIFDLTNKKDFERYFTLMKTEDELNPCYFIGVINYDLIFRRKRLKELTDFTLMLDESSMIQNESAERTKFILKLNPRNTILLSGTPTSGKYENLWSQIHLLKWDISKELYNKQYVNWKTLDLGGFKQKIVDKNNPYKNVDRLKNKLREHGAVFMKTEECFELPNQNFIKIKIDKTEEYNKFMKDSIIRIDTLNLHEFKSHDADGEENMNPNVELVGDTTLTKRLYSRMLCGQYCKDKILAFHDLLSSTNDRLIVFYNFNEEIDKLKRICKSYQRPISEINGTVKDLTNYENEDNSITFVQYQAGAMGLNLQKANKIVYFTLTEKSELFEQSKKRIHRIGQDKPCFYYLMLCEKSIEEDILKSLEMKRDYTDELFKNFDKK